jgi:hypothetical protein
VSVSGWARASYGWDFEGEKNLPKPDGDWDATGIGTTLKYTKDAWTVEGAAEVTTEDFGKNYGASGGIKTTWAGGDWTVYGKLSTNFKPVPTTTDPFFVQSQRTLELSVENWKQDVNDWGFKGLAQFRTVNNNDALLNSIKYDKRSDDNKFGLFLNLWDKKILLETGFGDYTDNNVWVTPGPLEKAYESKDDDDPAFRLQVKPFTGLSVGFAWLPATLFGDETYTNTSPTYYPNAGLALGVLGDVKPADTLRAVTYGAKYSVDPLTIAVGVNFQEDKEKGYAGASFKLGSLTLMADTEITFASDNGNFDLGEKVVYAASPLEIGLSVKELNLGHKVSGNEAKDVDLFAGPYIQYDLIEKVVRGKLAFEITKGLGENNKKDVTWKLIPTIGWSLKGDVALDPDDLATGFIAKYIYGVEDEQSATDYTGKKTTVNKLYFGFKTSF